MKQKIPALLFLSSLILLFSGSVWNWPTPVPAQTRPRKAEGSDKAAQPDRESGDPALPARPTGSNSPILGSVTGDTIKVNVDLVVVDALVMQRNTARVVGDLKREDFVVYEDGVKQLVTHFSQDALPLSVLLLIDRGGCLDPFGSQVRRAALDAMSRLKPSDEVGVMTYHNTAELLQGFAHDRRLIERALDRVPPHDERADHCLNIAMTTAADYMERASNPTGRRVVIVITGITRNFDCRNGPSGKSATHAILESGSVVCGIVPNSPEQDLENGTITMAAKMAGVFGAPSLSLKTLADETGGEVLEDKPEKLDTTFDTLMSHLRTRYALGFVSTNRKRDGTVRKLKLEVAPAVQKTQGKVVVKARRSYVAPRS